ncbi:MAG: LPXTG cell wall anchor domain-containing protein [Clostridia bacterium]|nr:LPXTG cell wall anchor domain-containing protein [Clostridia bacterium]
MKKIMLLVCILLCMGVCAYAGETTYSGVCDPIVIDQPGEHTIILDGVTIETAEKSAISVKAPATKLTIILKDGSENNLAGGFKFAGIANNGVELVICCENAGSGHKCTDACGKLDITVVYDASLVGGGGACIGSDAEKTFTGKVTIAGGNITAHGCLAAAGIGSGQLADFEGELTITGGNITSTGGHYASAIGAGQFGAFTGSVTISGGNVIADGYPWSAGIGSAEADMTGIITVTGGNVTASSRALGAGIGAGYGTMRGKIFITGGTVTASSMEEGDAIGSATDFEVDEVAVIEINPAALKMSGVAGVDADTAVALAGSPFAAKTNLKELLKGNAYAKFECITDFGSTSLPVTGDGTNVWLLAVLAAIGMIGMTVIIRKKNEA